MSGLLAMRDAIRDFLRKFDEVTTPIFRFIASYIMFSCLNSLFGYSEFMQRGMIVFLLSVICALVPNPIAVLLGGVTVIIQCLSISMDVGILSVLLFIILYCAYMRMFPDCSFALVLVPILFLFKIPYAAPVLIAIFAGFSGAVPAAFGVVIYYFSQYAKEAYDTIKLGTDADFQGYAHIVMGMAKDKQMLLTLLVFAIIVMLTSIVYRLSFDYAWYVAIGIGAISTVLFFMVVGMVLDVEVPMGQLVVNALLGGIVSVVVQMCKSIVDYSHKETVQFEDDEYYYYVKAIPKFGVAQKNKNIEKVTQRVPEERRRVQSPQSRPENRQPQNPQAKPQVRKDANGRPVSPRNRQ
ncbi:MAG: hypothetical protein ACI4EK_05590 [Wujia sp.]